MLRGSWKHGAQAGGQRDILERAHVDEAEAKSGFGNEANFKAARGADKEDFGFVAFNQLVGYGEGGNNVAAGAASGNENSQFRQPIASPCKKQSETGGIHWL